jgi:hypothetical protein
MPATDTLSLVVEAIAPAYNEGCRRYLWWAVDNDDLEVRWTLAEIDHGYASMGGPADLRPTFWAEAFDISTPPCWDGCNGITTMHRAGWCRTNAEHADFDCGCGTADYDEEDDYFL